MSKVTYSVADGHVLRGTEKVAAYNSKTGELEFLPDMANYRAPVVRFLREQNLPAEVPPDRPAEAGNEPRAQRVGVNQDRPAEPEPVAEVAPESPEGVEPGAPELPPPAAEVAASEFGHVKLTGGQKAYRDRLTPEGWV